MTADAPETLLTGRAPAGMSAGDEVLSRYVQLDRRRTGRVVIARVRDGLLPETARAEADMKFVRWASATDLSALPADAR